MAERTPEQMKKKESQDAYMAKLKDIKVRVPLEYYDTIEEHLEEKAKKEKTDKLSVNKWILSLIQKEIGERIVSIREKNKIQKGENKAKE